MPPPRHSPPRPAAQAALLAQAVAQHQAGRLDEAAALYGQVLQQAPGHFDATHLSGVIALQRGHLAEAQTLIRAALAVNPKDAAALNNLGTVLLRSGRLDEAAATLERALKQQPGHVDALVNLGTVLRGRGRLAEAIAPLRRALAAQPKSAAAADLLGATLLDTGDLRGAVAAYEAGAKAQPRAAAAWRHLALACNRLGSAARALAAADAALALQPDDAAALGERGIALAALARPADARAAFDAATRAAPRDAATWNNLGSFLRDQGEFDAALAQLQRAIELDPGLVAAQENQIATLLAAGRGAQALAQGERLAAAHPAAAGAQAALAGALQAQGRVEAARDAWAKAAAAVGADAATHCAHGNAEMAAGDAAAAQRAYQRAIAADPADAKPRWAAAMATLPPIPADAKAADAARRAFTRALAELDAWCTPARAAAAAAAVGTTQPFYLAYQAEDNTALLAQHGRLCARLMQAGAPAVPAQPPRPAGRLRLGLVSAQVQDHSVWIAIARGWLAHLDPLRFEIHVFHLGSVRDAETARARTQAARFVDAPGPGGWAETIRGAALDVLIYPEIGMDAQTTRLASQRLAPVQAASWGHPQTSGLPTLDLYLSADALEPPGADRHYGERLVRLPHLGVCVSPRAPTATPPDLAALGLPAGEPLLLCPGTPFKYAPADDALWADLGRRLQAAGRGRLVFFRSPRPAMAAALEARLRRAFADGGADFERTVCLVPTLDRPRFFGLMQHAAAMLDTPGFSGFNTALQALEAGLPVVAWEGAFLRGRLASGPLRRIGLDDWVATTHAGFAAAAMRLVDDDALRLALRHQIAERRGALFDDRAPVAALAAVLEEAVAAARAAAPAPGLS